MATNSHANKGNTVRQRPGWQIARLIRRAGVTQHEIAKQARVSQSFVSSVIRRIATDSPKTEAVWAAVEKALGR